jgi:hypothetical protein
MNDLEFLYTAVKKLGGPIKPIGETNEDKYRYENLGTLIELVAALKIIKIILNIAEKRLEKKQRNLYILSMRNWKMK